MRFIFTSTLLFLVITSFYMRPAPADKPELDCILRSDKQVYKIGELPEFEVSIINKSKKDIYLLGSLDGSDHGWRKPHCYFIIQKPAPDTIQRMRCGNMNPIRTKDFQIVKAGTSFDPYQKGFFPDYNVKDIQTFRNPGTYKISFVYSSNATDINAFGGDHYWRRLGDSARIVSLFEKLAKVDLQSNEIEIRVEK